MQGFVVYLSISYVRHFNRAYFPLKFRCLVKLHYTQEGVLLEFRDRYPGLGVFIQNHLD